MNQLKGTIDYTLTLEENNVWKLSYNQTIDNDIASIAISEHVLGILGDKLEIDKKSAKGKEAKFLQQRIDKVVQAKFGLGLMFDYTIKLYDIYMKGMAAKKVAGDVNAADINLGEPPEEEAKIMNLNPRITTEENITNLSENKD